MGKIISVGTETLIQKIDLEFKEFRIGLVKFPLLFKTGSNDTAVHATGVSYLLGLGLEFGLSSIAEYPITLHSDDHWRSFGKIFPDSVWFHPQTNQPWVIFEFERFEKGDELKIQEKAKNLALSYYQSKQSVEICILIYWLRSGYAPNSISPIMSIFSNGFMANHITVPPPQCRFLVYKFVFCQANQLQQTVNRKRIVETQQPYKITSESNNSLVIFSTSKVVGEKV
jgi:hypothetical protein